MCMTNEWTCSKPSCGASNSPIRITCRVCGRSRYSQSAGIDRPRVAAPLDTIIHVRIHAGDAAELERAIAGTGLSRPNALRAILRRGCADVER